jgi:hypothetical protein
MKVAGFIVTQGGLPCCIYNAAATKRGGVLLPLLPGAGVEVFSAPRDAKRAIARTQRVAAQLAGSFVNDWLKLTPLQSGQPYAVLPLGGRRE